MKSETVGAYAALLVGTAIACISLVAYGLLENQSEGFVYANLAQQRSVCAQLAETLKVERDVIKETMAMYRTEVDKSKDMAEKLVDITGDLTASQDTVRVLSMAVHIAKIWNDTLKKQLVDAGIKPAKILPYVIMKGEKNDGSSNGGGDTEERVPSACAPFSDT